MNVSSMIAATCLWSAATLPTLAASAPEAVLLTKTNNSGFTTTAGYRQETCNLYAKRLVISRRYGMEPGLFIVEERPLEVGGELTQVMAAAQGEALVQTANLLCDGPSTEVSMPGSQPGGAPIVLFATGGCGSPSLRRDGPSTRILRDVIDSYCPRTIEAPQQ